MRWAILLAVFVALLATFVLSQGHSMNYSTQTIRYRVNGEVRAELQRVSGRHKSTEEWIAQFQSMQGSDPKLECWQSGEGEYEIETPRMPGETEQEWCDRHDDAVETAKETYPDEGPCDE